MIGSQSSSEYKPSSRAKNSVNLYNKVLHYSKLTATPDMKKHQQILKKFIQFSDQRALFVFGPSGSGKRTFINSYFNRYKVPFVWVNQQVCFNTQDMDEEWPDDGQMQINKKVTSIRQLITKSVSKSDTNIVQIYSDFPFPNSDSNIRQLQSIKTFKQNFFKNLRASGCKIIFILNSQIYNRYFIVPKDCPSCISQFTLKPYTSTEVKTILKQFVKEHTVFQWIIKSKDNLDEVIEVSNGDMRKVLLNVLKITMDGSSTKMENMNKQQKSEYKLKLKNEQKFPLFHMLGKYLYAKRYDPIQKKDRVFTRQQLIKSDPPFYFNPVDLYYKSTVPLNTFTDLLFENYTAKVGRIQDVKQIATLFCALDTIFPAFITNKKIDSINEQMQELYICMLTWGIILKNKSSASLEKRFASFRKSQAKYIANQIQAKKTLFKTYFPYSRRQNLIRWGYIVKNSKPSKKYLISDLIRKRSRMMNVLRQDNERVMGQEQEQQLMKMQTNGCQDFLKSYNQKKQKKEKQDMILKEMLEQQESDIDQENQC